MPPTLWQNFRHVIGRALRETGQSLHRLGVKTTSLAITKHDYYDDPCIYEDHLSRHRQLFPLPISGRPVLHQHIAYIAPCATLIGSVYVGRNSSIWYGAVVRGDTCENTVSLRTRYKIEEGVNEDGTIDAPSTPQPLPVLDGHTGNHQQQQSATTSAAILSPEEQVAPLVSTSNTDTSLLQNIPKPWPLSATRHKDQLDHHGGAIFIGDNTNVQDAAIITSFQNHCTIGNNVTIGHSAQLHSCTVHDNVLIGMGSIINEGAVIETNAFIAAGAVVPERTIVPSGTLWMGNPARYVRDLTPVQIEKILYQSSEYVQVALTHQHVMELGGNVDPESGVAVYLTSDDIENDEDDQNDDTLVEQSSTGSSNSSALGHMNGTVHTDNHVTTLSSQQSSDVEPVLQQPDKDAIQVVGSNNR